MTTRVPRRRARLSPDKTAEIDLLAVFEQWAALKDQTTLIATRQSELKDAMQAYLEEHGEKDEKGSLILALPEPVSVGKKQATSIMRQRRVSSSMDEDKAVELLASKGLLERAQKTITVLDHDEIYVLHQQDLLTEAEIDSLITETVTWAFVPVTA